MEHIVADRGPILLIFFIATSLVQISPININPWSAILKWLGRQMNHDVIEKVDNIEARLDAHIKDYAETTLKARRSSILDFGSSVIRGTNHQREKFDFMISECDSYQEYCKENKIKNGVADASIAEIRRIYQLHLRNNDFLVENGGGDDDDDKAED